MVNTGKPSRGCQNCKDRRVKCDLTFPSCLRCSKTGRKCPGVKSEGDVAFVGRGKYALMPKSKENGESGDKQSAALSYQVGSPDSSNSWESPVEVNLDFPTSWESSNATSPDSFTWESSSSTPLSLTTLPSTREVSPLIASPSPQPHEWALKFFFEHFSVPALEPVLRPLRQHYATSTFGSLPALDNTILALSWASWSTLGDMNALKAVASRHYGQALRLVGQSLGDPVLSKSDNTLLCVILMGMYERLAVSEGSIRFISRHGAGAVALVRHRGKPTDTNSAFYRLFTGVRRSAVLEALAKSTELDPEDVNNFWFFEDLEQLRPVDKIDRLYLHGSPVPALRNRASELFELTDRQPSAEQVSKLLVDARKVDMTLLHWAETLPTGWHFSTNFRNNQSLLYADRRSDTQAWCGIVHKYPDMWMATMFNSYRVLRITVQSVIARCLSCLSQISPDSVMPTEFLHLASMHAVRSLVDDIVASVPAHLGDVIVADKKTAELARGPHSKAHQALAAGNLLRPLWAAAMVEGIDSDLKFWILERLRFIGQEFGLGQVLKNGETLPVIRMTWRNDDRPMNTRNGGLAAGAFA